MGSITFEAQGLHSRVEMDDDEVLGAVAALLTELKERRAIPPKDIPTDTPREQPKEEKASEKKEKANIPALLHELYKEGTPTSFLSIYSYLRTHGSQSLVNYDIRRILREEKLPLPGWRGRRAAKERAKTEASKSDESPRWQADNRRIIASDLRASLQQVIEEDGKAPSLETSEGRIALGKRIGKGPRVFNNLASRQKAQRIIEAIMAEGRAAEKKEGRTTHHGPAERPPLSDPAQEKAGGNGVDEEALLLERVYVRGTLMDVSLGPEEQIIMERLYAQGKVEKGTEKGHAIWKLTEGV